MLQTKWQQRKPLQPPQSPSKVLLVCIYDTMALELTNDVLHQKFQPFGHIIKLLIFQRSEVTKCFVEYSEVEQAQNARNQLDGIKLYGNICKMNIYFSNFTNVDLKNQTSQGIDYSNSDKEAQLFLNRYDQLTKSSPEEDTDVFNDLLMQSFDSPLTRAKTDNPVLLSSIQNKLNSQQISKESEIDRSIRSDINQILESSSAKSQETTSSPLKLREAVKAGSTVMCFYYNWDMEVRHIYNLFSNFGNIAGIVKKRNWVYIRFRSLQFASITYSYLNNHHFMGNTLVLQSPISQNQIFPRQGEWSECLFFDTSSDRFTQKKSITINSPSTTLHVSSLRKDICREDTLHSIFSEYGEIQSIQILKQSQDKNMALVKYYSLEDSFRAIAEMHNEVFGGRKIQISFTKTRGS